MYKAQGIFITNDKTYRVSHKRRPIAKIFQVDINNYTTPVITE